MNRTTRSSGQTARVREESHNDVELEDEQNILQYKICWVRPKSKQDILNIHKFVGEENDSGVLTKHAPTAVLDNLSDAVGYGFLDEENMKAINCSEVCGEYWKKNEKRSELCW